MTDEALTSTTPAASATKRPRAYRKSGVFRLKRALKERGLKALDGRSSLARSIVEWRGAVLADLGADLSRQEETVLDLAASAYALLAVIDGWLGAHPELIVSTRRRNVAQVVRERGAVASHLVELLKVLGLRRKARELPSLSQYVSGKKQEPAA